jgi:uncharacterized protein involved in outer membrane biogenesis
VNLVDPVKTHLQFELDTGSLGLLATVDADTRIELDLAGGRYGAKDLSLEMSLSGKAVPGDHVAVTLAGEAAFDANTQKIDLAGIRLKASDLDLASYTAEALLETSGAGDLAAGIIRLGSLAASATLTGEEDRITAELTAAADVDLKTKRFYVTNLVLNLPELVLKGLEAGIESTGTGSAMADLAAGTIVLDVPALAGTLSGESVPGGSMPLALDLQARGDLNRKTFTVEPVALSVADMTVTANLHLAQAEAGPQVSGTLAAAPFNLRDLLSRWGAPPMNTANPQALSTAAVDMEFHADAGTAAIDNLSFRLDDSTLTGTLGVKNFEAPETTLDLSMDRLQLDRYLPPDDGTKPSRLLTDVTLKGMFTAESGFNLFRVAQLALAGKLNEKMPFGVSVSDAHADMDKKTLSAETLVLNAGGMALTARAGVTNFSSNPSFSAEIQAETFNLRKILSDLDLMPETADAEALSAVGISAALGGSAEAVSLSSLALRLDDTNITGKADLRFIPSPAYTVDIAVDNMDADRYLPPKADAEAETSQVATPGAATTAIPTELLRGLDLDARLSVGALKIADLRLTDIRLQASANEGLLTLHPLSADLYDGAYSGNIRVDARGPVPLLSLDENLAGVQSGGLLKDLQGKAFISGLASTGMKLTAAGTDADALLASLDGTVSFTFTDGSIKGVDIVGKICRTLTAANAGSLKTEDLVGSALQMLVQKAGGTESTGDESAEADSTKFSEISGSMTFEKGVGTSEDLSLKSPMLRVEGAGALDLGRQYLDYEATAALVKSCEGQGGKSFADLKNIPIPVTIEGPLDDLEVKPNLTAGILKLLTRKQNKQEDETPATTSDQQPTADQPPEEPETVEESETVEKPETVEDALKGMLQDLLE